MITTIQLSISCYQSIASQPIVSSKIRLFACLSILIQLSLHVFVSVNEMAYSFASSVEYYLGRKGLRRADQQNLPKGCVRALETFHDTIKTRIWQEYNG